jgi:hypothetical protein
MFDYIASCLWWIGWRAAITFACLITVQRVIMLEGYRLHDYTLLAIGVVFIVGVRVWSPTPDKKG